MKAVNFFRKKLHLNILSGPENASGFTVFNYFHRKLHLRSLREQICLCMYLVPQIWRWINEISKVGYEETKECVVSENSCSENFVNFQEKYPGEIDFLNKVAGYLTLTGNVLLGNLWNFQKTFIRNTRECRLLPLVVTGKCFDQNIFFKKYIIRFFSFTSWYSMACVPQGLSV